MMRFRHLFEAMDEFKAHLAQFSKSEPHQQAIQSHVNQAGVNKSARRHLPNPDIDRMADIASHKISGDQVLYRGIQGAERQYWASKKPGDVHIDHGFLGVSSKKKIADKFTDHSPHVLQIHAPAGTQVTSLGADHRDAGAAEKEWVFQRGTNFRLEKHETNPDGSTISHVSVTGITHPKDFDSKPQHLEYEPERVTMYQKAVAKKKGGDKYAMEDHDQKKKVFAPIKDVPGKHDLSGDYPDYPRHAIVNPDGKWNEYHYSYGGNPKALKWNKEYWHSSEY